MQISTALHIVKPLFSEVEDELAGGRARPWIALSACFTSAAEAWLWACTAFVAASRGEVLPGPCDPEIVMECAEGAGLSRLEWHILNRVGMSGFPPEDPSEVAVYGVAIRKIAARLDRVTIFRR